MKRLIFLLLFVIPLLSGCEKESEIQSDSYYVRYEYNLSFISPIGGSSYVNKTISISTDLGTIEVATISNSYTETIGPVKKGFTANISVKYDNGDKGGTTGLKIYVCRGSEPFALKAVNEPYRYTASYTIDF